MQISSRLVSTIGFVAAFSTTVSFVPQLVRVYRLKTARDISLGMFLFFTWGTVCWLTYGIVIHSMPVTVSNLATLVLSAGILVLKLKYDRNARQIAKSILKVQP